VPCLFALIPGTRTPCPLLTPHCPLPRATQLYNITEDPQESNNIAKKHPVIVEELMARMHEVAMQSVEPMQVGGGAGVCVLVNGTVSGMVRGDGSGWVCLSLAMERLSLRGRCSCLQRPCFPLPHRTLRAHTHTHTHTRTHTHTPTHTTTHTYAHADPQWARPFQGPQYECAGCPTHPPANGNPFLPWRAWLPRKSELSASVAVVGPETPTPTDAQPGDSGPSRDSSWSL
jgi:hypothetical protein